MQHTDQKSFRFLIEREAGHTQIVTARGATHVEAMLAVCQANPGRSVERYRTSLAREKGATEHERAYPGTRYEHGSPADPATWDEGDLIVDRRGHRALVVHPLGPDTCGGIDVIKLAPGKKCDGELACLHVLALANTYGYERTGRACPDELPGSFEAAAPSSHLYDSRAEVRALIGGA